ncbi:hypothetical protein AYO49_03880 [Verrucomicrobiaceae bacterium SCGC AG-212-N21]|nr:hypothetical protein AYO49_03880 [Verrucomicrobiaceae bacterium SCGC AG-212-N21]
MLGLLNSRRDFDLPSETRVSARAFRDGTLHAKEKASRCHGCASHACMNTSEPSHPGQGETRGTPPITIQSLTSATRVSPAAQAPSVSTIPPPGHEASLPVQEAVTPTAAVRPISTSVIVSPGIPERTPRESLLVTYWRKIGAGSLLLSLLIHVGLFMLAAMIVTVVVTKEQAADFLPGGGSKSGDAASEQLAQQVKMKKKNLLNKSTPMQKVVSSSMTAAISLPETPLDTIDMPEMSSLLGGGAMSGGFGSSGSGGGFGDGAGIGGMSGRTFKPIIMFGNDIKARSIAVILDVSGSMTPHLTKVIKELDRVAKGSPVVLYVGCGVVTPPKGKRIDDNAIETRRQAKDEDKNFEIFWRKSHTQRPNTPAGSPPPPPKGKNDPPDPIPEEAVYAVMANRPSTYFIKAQGIQYSWVSLLVNEVRQAEALYWFSDFQDAVDEEQLASVLSNLKRRKQKLFIHASVKGRSFEQVRDQLVLPSGGAVISEQPVKK